VCTPAGARRCLLMATCLHPAPLSTPLRVARPRTWCTTRQPTRTSSCHLASCLPCWSRAMVAPHQQQQSRSTWAYSTSPAAALLLLVRLRCIMQCAVTAVAIASWAYHAVSTSYRRQIVQGVVCAMACVSYSCRHQLWGLNRLRQGVPQQAEGLLGHCGKSVGVVEQTPCCRCGVVMYEL
jgi:hypothetical protein